MKEIFINDVREATNTKWKLLAKEFQKSFYILM